MQRCRIVLLIERYAGSVVSVMTLPMNEREHNIQKYKEMVTKVKFVKTVEQYYVMNEYVLGICV